MPTCPVISRWITWMGGIALVLVTAVLLAATIADEPVRKYVEDKANASLNVYTLRIGKLDLHPLTLSLDLENVTLIQKRHPDPPMAHIPKWHVGIQLGGLLTGKLVSAHRIDGPSAELTRPQAKRGLKETPPSGWQDIVRTLFPLRISELKVEQAQVTYYDHSKAQPMKLTDVQFEAGEISNRGGEGQEYPTPVKMEARLPQGGRITAKGHANVLTKPLPAFTVDFNLDDIALQDFADLAAGYDVQLDRGKITANGHAEYAPWKHVADVRDIRLEGVRADYVYRRRPTDEARRAEAVAVTKKAKDNSLLVVNVKQGKVVGSEFGFVNKAATPHYRVFVGEVNADLNNFTTRLRELAGGEAVVKATGRFMGTGRSVMTGTFRSETPFPDFDVGVQIVKTELKSFNDVLRAYTDFDVHQGNLSVFSELSVRHKQVSGYLKPIFKDVEVYDPEQDTEKARTNKVFESVISDIVELLNNPSQDQVAADAGITSPVTNPSAETWQVMSTLIQNAFFKAILPGLEKEQGKA
ncbi:MAG: DUF748 domain-containing protein [Nitrospira sp.]|nr:DUF748 domain-containing protein [Nitrospira sp.]